jgi:thiamine biosynthesis lipoprotein
MNARLQLRHHFATRSWIKVLVLASFWLVLVLALTSRVMSQSQNSALTRYTYGKPEMGVPFRFVLYATNQTQADAAADAAFARIQKLNDIMSDYDPESELSKLSGTSGTGREIRVSQDLWHVLQRAEALAERSGGAFDVTVGPYVILWRKARRQNELPEPALLEEARRAVGYRHIRLNPTRQSVELLVPGMRLDLGGIAKGYAVDEGLKVLREAGISRALVEGGGDVAVGEPPPGKTGWRIELSPLDATNAPAARFLSLKHAAISTSGDLYQRVEIGGKRYSHIVDPFTGIGLTDHSLVSVIAPDSITADSLTKVVSVLSPEKSLVIIEATSGVAARIVRKPAEKIEVYQSKRFERYYQRD